VLAASSHAATSFTDLGVFVYNNYKSSSEVEGRVIVGGHLNGSASNVGIHLNQSAYVGIDTLIVGRNINAGNVQLQAGNARIGGIVTGNLNLNSGGTLTTQDLSVTGMIDTMRDTFVNASALYAGLAETGTVSLPGSQPAGVTFTATPDAEGLSVINVSASDIFSNSKVQQIDIDLAGADRVVINVSGNGVDFTSAGNFVGAFNNDSIRSRVIWNFYEAENIDLKGKGFSGSILANSAYLTHEGIITGSVFVDSMYSQSEVHMPGLEGMFPPLIPTPGAVAIIGLAGFTGLRRRR
jgi:choice-of-anchor A domain-containing protein/MYXO-CTERM domain-containing protein